MLFFLGRTAVPISFICFASTTMTSGTSLADGVSVQPGHLLLLSLSGDCPFIAVNPFLVPHYIWLSPSVLAGVSITAFLLPKYLLKGETFLSKQVRKGGTPCDVGSVPWISVLRHHVSQLLQSTHEICPASVAWKAAAHGQCCVLSLSSSFYLCNISQLL